MKTTFENEALQELVKIAKENGYRVFAFQKDKPISQVLIVSESGKIGSASASWRSVLFNNAQAVPRIWNRLWSFGREWL